MIYVGGPPPCGSNVGHSFSMMMKMANGEFPWDPMVPVEDEINTFNERRLRVKVGDEWLHGRVENMARFNNGPFSPTISWGICVRFASAATAAKVYASGTGAVNEDHGRLVRIRLHRCDPTRGGTLQPPGTSVLLSFEWLSPPPRNWVRPPAPIPIRDTETKRLLQPNSKQITSSCAACHIGEQLEENRRYNQATEWYQRGVSLSEEAEPYSVREHMVALSNLGLCLKRANKFEEALAAYDAALALPDRGHWGDDDHAWHNKRMLLEEVENWNGTAGEFDGLLAAAAASDAAMQAAAQERERDERRKQKAAAKQPKVAGKAKAAPAEGGRSRLMSRLAPAEPPAGPSAAGCKKTIRKEPANKCR